MPNISFREYHPLTGALLGNVSVLNFGDISTASTSKVKVIDIVFGGVDSVSNVKLGLIYGGGLIVNADPVDISADGSAQNGHFGIGYSSSFSASTASAPLTRHFAGSNDDGTSGNEANVLVGNRSPTISNFIYLDIEVGATKVLRGNGAYKVFFDYS